MQSVQLPINEHMDLEECAVEVSRIHDVLATGIKILSDSDNSSSIAPLHITESEACGMLEYTLYSVIQGLQNIHDSLDNICKEHYRKHSPCEAV
ncbi:MAG: hypothetical protein IKE43_06065 [Coriobacteriales bacterium]|nr:hypothetical protein [Coriobacteriales bacterium]